MTRSRRSASLGSSAASEGTKASKSSDVLEAMAVAAYYERKERLRPRRSASQASSSAQALAGSSKDDPNANANANASNRKEKKERSKKGKLLRSAVEVGARIEVLFDDPPEYYPAMVAGYDRKTGLYSIQYDDGDH